MDGVQARMTVERLPASLEALAPGFEKLDDIVSVTQLPNSYSVFVVFACCEMIPTAALQGIVNLVRRRYNLAQMFFVEWFEDIQHIFGLHVLNYSHVSTGVYLLYFVFSLYFIGLLHLCLSRTRLPPV